MTLTVDVAIPCYRYGHFLRECVQSVLSQEGIQARVLILDDCSPDNTAEVGRQLAESDPRVEYRYHTENKGHIATYNEGIDWASGDLFLLLSADDYLAPGALSRVAQLFEANEDMSFVFGNASLVFDNGMQELREPFAGKRKRQSEIFSCLDFVKAMSGQNIVPTPTAVVRTSAQKHVGGYCQALPHAGDMAMWLRLAATGPVGFINATQAVYRMHSSNMSRSYSAARLPDVQQRRAAIDHFLEYSAPELKNPRLFKTLLFQALGRNSIYQAGEAFNEGDIATANRLSDLAKELYPDVWRSRAWLRYLANRALGPRVWQVLRSMRG
ncbi:MULTISPECIES: glycosyltransferase family 2 protein [unclassified Rhizobium]|uniref:glycosyltransferase family 2 protein n=1 Tax=unclassified Rhizobium TaxID=2613769 RepID=UPI000DDB3AD8|nr:glycosyltransferase family 2 protein [Rhizobium sp. UBA1881]